MAKTPKQKGPRPSPRRATDDWHVNLARLLEPLTPEQRDTLSAIFKERKEDATSLLQDWKRISEVAHYVALRHAADATITKLLFGKGLTRAVRMQLREATAAADTATEAVTTMVDLWGPLADSPGQATAVLELRTLADAVISRLAREREAMKRRCALLPVPAKRGKPDQPETYRLRVLASYFRHHEWPVSSSMNGEFALTCEVVTSTPL